MAAMTIARRKTCELCGTKLRSDLQDQAQRCRACCYLEIVEASLVVADVAVTTPHRPGSPNKMVVMARRLRAGLPLHSPGESVGDIPD